MGGEGEIMAEIKWSPGSVVDNIAWGNIVGAERFDFRRRHETETAVVTDFRVASAVRCAELPSPQTLGPAEGDDELQLFKIDTRPQQTP